MAHRSNEVSHLSRPLCPWLQLPLFLPSPQMVRSGTACPRSPCCEYKGKTGEKACTQPVSSWEEAERIGSPPTHPRPWFLVSRPQGRIQEPWHFISGNFSLVNFTPSIPARVVLCPNAIWPHLRANGCCALFPVPWQHGPCSLAGVIGTGCSSGQAGGTVQLAPRRGGEERMGRGCPGAALRGSEFTRLLPSPLLLQQPGGAATPPLRELQHR